MGQLDDLALIIGGVVVGYFAYKEWYDGMSIEAILDSIDRQARGFLDDVISKLPALPAPPQFQPPTPQFQFLPPTPPPEPSPQPQTLNEPTDEKGEPVKDEAETGQLPESANTPQASNVPNVSGPIVAFAGDWDNNAKAKATVASMGKHGVQYVVNVGDNGYDTDATTWFNNVMAPFKGKIKSALGNHDAKEKSTYASLFGQSSSWNYVHPIIQGKLAVVFIDTESGITEIALDNLTKSAKGQATHVAYAFHKPYITSSNAHHGPSENKWSAIIDKVAKKYGVKLLTAGHNHLYEHFMCNGTHYVTTGAAGRKFYQGNCQGCGPVKCVNNTNGWLKVTVGNDLLCQFVDNSGQIHDTFTISAGAGGEKQAVQQFMRAYIQTPMAYYGITRNRR